MWGIIFPHNIRQIKITKQENWHCGVTRANTMNGIVQIAHKCCSEIWGAIEDTQNYFWYASFTTAHTISKLDVILMQSEDNLLFIASSTPPPWRVSRSQR